MTQESSDKKGYVYILMNPAFSGFLKVGKTTKEPDARARELSSVSGVPAPYSVAWVAFVNDCDHVEKLIHQQLSHTRSRKDREFFAIPLRDAISIVSRIVAPFSCDFSTGSTTVLPANNEAHTSFESNITSTTLERTDFSSTAFDVLSDAIVSFTQIVLPRKKNREAEAADILREFKGRYTDTVLDKIFDLVDNDPSGLWFAQMLCKPNREFLYRSQMIELNVLIDKLVETGDLGWLGRWRRAGNGGMRAGVASLVMYLWSPEKYNIWNNKTHDGLSIISNLGIKSPKKELSAEEYSIFYKRFNEAVITVREKNGFDPQTMDWFLWAVNEFQNNPGSRTLRAYVEGKIR